MGRTCHLESPGSCVSPYHVTGPGTFLDLSFLNWNMGELAAWGQEDIQTSASPRMLFHKTATNGCFEASFASCVVKQFSQSGIKAHTRDGCTAPSYFMKVTF